MFYHIKYEKVENPNLKYLRLWGCLAFYRIYDQQTLKLGSREIKNMFVGYAKNSKAYRLKNLDFNIKVESRDVKFIKNKFCNDSTPELEPIYNLLQNLAPSIS